MEEEEKGRSRNSWMQEVTIRMREKTRNTLTGKNGKKEIKKKLCHRKM